MKTGKKISLNFNQCERKAKELYDKNPKQLDYKALAIYTLNTASTIKNCYNILKVLYQNIVNFKYGIQTLRVAKLKQNIKDINKSIDSLQLNMKQRLQLINGYLELNKSHWLFYKVDERKRLEALKRASQVLFDVHELEDYMDYMYEGIAMYDKVRKLIDEGYKEHKELMDEYDRQSRILLGWANARREVDKQIWMNTQLIEANQYEYSLREFNKEIYNAALEMQEDKRIFWSILSELSFLEI